jgi:hypothetical protein
MLARVAMQLNDARAGGEAAAASAARWEYKFLEERSLRRMVRALSACLECPFGPSACFPAVYALAHQHQAPDISGLHAD